jgi:hypothetical protein
MRKLLRGSSNNDGLLSISPRGLVQNYVITWPKRLRIQPVSSIVNLNAILCFQAFESSHVDSQAFRAHMRLHAPSSPTAVVPLAVPASVAGRQSR